jgi:hypothetical protein
MRNILIAICSGMLTYNILDLTLSQKFVINRKKCIMYFSLYISYCITQIKTKKIKNN